MIIIFGTDFNGGETVFYDGENMHDIGKRAHVLKHSHGMCVIGYFEKNYTKAHFGLAIELFYHLSSTNQYIFVLCIMVQDFMKIYISSKNRLKYIDDDGSGVLPKLLVRKKYNSRYQKTHSNHYYVLKNDYIKDTRMRRTYSGRKRKATGYVLINGSPYRDAEGSPT